MIGFEKYGQIQLRDGRRGIILDQIEDELIVQVMDVQTEWEIISVRIDDDEYYHLDDHSQVFNLCPYKKILLRVTEAKEYCFLLGYDYDDEYYPLEQQQYEDICRLLNIDPRDEMKSWKHYFTYNKILGFINAYKMVTCQNGFYYVYEYDKIEKTADALYRVMNGIFERYFPREGIWREMPEQRMILKDKKARYEQVTEEEAMGLALLV